MFSSDTFFVVGLLAFAWLLQIMFSSWQMKRFHAKTQKLRRLGTHTSIGMAGTTYKRKTYTVLVVDDNLRVTAAEKLSGVSVLAGSKPVPEMVGIHLDDIGKGDPPAGVADKTWQSFDLGADFIRRKLARGQAAAEPDDDSN